MKKYLLTALVVVVTACIFVALGITFPVYARMLPLLFILFVMDGYLWLAIRRTVMFLQPPLKYTALIIYWLPLILLVGCIVAGAFISFAEWNIPLRTLVPGLIVILYTFKILPFFFQLIRDIARLFIFGLHSFSHGGVKFSHTARLRWIQFTGWIAGTVFLIVMILGMVWWNYDFRVTHQEITLPELPASFDGLKIVQISDIHAGSWLCKRELRKAVDLVNDQHADVIFFTGDMVNYTTLDALPFEEILTHLKAPYGIFAILGNHDYGAYVNWPSPEAKEKDKKDLYAFYHRLGWRLLLNEHSVLRKGNDSIAVLGVHNWGKAYRFQKLGDIPAAQKGIENMQVQLLLSHDPSFWDSIICHKFRNIDITFSGHTHGFQFGIDCFGIHWSPAQYLYNQWGGLYANPVPGSHPQYIYVNVGLGSIAYPGRIGILPEITVITLKRGN
jgi:predicted MPP superfamily phosphohydrolase